MRAAPLLLAALVAAPPLAAQSGSPADPVITLGAAHRIRSAALGEDRPYFV